MTTTFENMVSSDLHRYLLTKGEIDEHLPECPDVEALWETVAMAYLPDGVREFNAYPLTSLGWMMLVGMAVAACWDKDWKHYSTINNLYVDMRDKRGYDQLDEYICDEVLQLDATQSEQLLALVGDCATRLNSTLRHTGAEAGTAEAFRAYVACLHQLYLKGMAVQLHRMGYRMTRL